MPKCIFLITCPSTIHYSTMYMVNESMTCLHTHISKNWVTVKSGKIMHNHLFINVDSFRGMSNWVHVPLGITMIWKDGFPSSIWHSILDTPLKLLLIKYQYMRIWMTKKINKSYFASLACVHSVMEPWRLLPTHSTGREEGGRGCGLLGRIRAGLGGVHPTVSDGLGHH